MGAVDGSELRVQQQTTQLIRALDVLLTLDDMQATAAATAPWLEYAAGGSVTRKAVTAAVLNLEAWRWLDAYQRGETQGSAEWRYVTLWAQLALLARTEVMTEQLYVLSDMDDDSETSLLSAPLPDFALRLANPLFMQVETRTSSEDVVFSAFMELLLSPTHETIESAEPLLPEESEAAWAFLDRLRLDLRLPEPRVVQRVRAAGPLQEPQRPLRNEEEVSSVQTYAAHPEVQALLDQLDAAQM